MEAQGLLPVLFPYTLLTAWLAGSLVALAAHFRGRRLHQAAGLGLMAVPLWLTLWGILNSLEPLLSGGVVLRPYSTYELSNLYSRSLLSDLGYLGVGFLLYARGDSWTRMLSASPTAIARDLQRSGLPLGRGGEPASLAAGLLLFPLLLGATIAVNLLTAGVDVLHQGDEESVWDNMTVFHALLIALAAAFGEELLYRGFLQGALTRVSPAPLAIVAQALFFGFAHAGYGTWIHVLLPFLFGLVSGVVAWRWGIWAAIAMHFLVDLVAFGVYVAEDQAWFGALLGTLLLANAVATVAYGAAWAGRKLVARRRMTV